MSARLGRWGASWYMLPSRRRGQMGSFQLGTLGKNSPMTCRILIPGQAGLCVLSDSRFISLADLGKRRRVVFGFGPVPVFDALSRWQMALMDVSPILLAAQSVGKMMLPALAKKILYDSHGRRSLDMVPPLKQKALPSGMVIIMVIAGSASGKSLLAARPTGSRERAPRRRNWLRFTRLLSGVSS